MEKTARERNFFRQTHHFFKIMPVKLQKVIRKSLGKTKEKVAEGETLKLVSVNFCKNTIFVLRKRCFCEFWRASAG